jgi:hypothetical protein
MLRHITPWLSLCFITALLASILFKRSQQREIHHLAKAPQNSTFNEAHICPHSHVTLCRLVLYVIAIICIIVGIFNGGLYDILVKAINICTECIGLG